MDAVGGWQNQRSLSCQKLLVGLPAGFQSLGAGRGTIAAADFIQIARDPRGIEHKRFDSLLHGGNRFLYAGAQSLVLDPAARLLTLLHPAPQFIVVGKSGNHRSLNLQEVFLRLKRQRPHYGAVIGPGTTLNLQQLLHQGNGKHQSQPSPPSQREFSMDGVAWIAQ